MANQAKVTFAVLDVMVFPQFTMTRIRLNALHIMCCRFINSPASHAVPDLGSTPDIATPPVYMRMPGASPMAADTFYERLLLGR